MADTKKRSIQFRRNTTTIYANADAAKEAILGNLASYLDGEQIFGRYTVTEGGNAVVKTLVGYVYVNGDNKHVTFTDVTSLTDELHELSGKTVTEITSTGNTVGVTSAVTTDGTVTFNIEAHKPIIGTGYTAVTYDESFADSAQTIAIGDAYDLAFNKVENTLVSLVDRTIEDEETTAMAISALTDAMGNVISDDDKIKYQANTNANYINNAESLTDADDKLDAAIKELSGKSEDDIIELSGKTVGKVEISQLTSGNTHNYTDADADLYQVSATTLSGGVLTDNFQLTFTPYSPAELQVPKTIGDIEKGTKASELNGETLSKVLDDIIFPTVYPDIVDPSATIAFVNTGTSRTVKVGSTLENMKVTYTRGTAKVDDGVTTDRNYTGNLTGATFQYAYTAGTKSDAAGVAASGTSVSSGSPADVTSSVVSSAITTTVGGNDVITGATSAMTLSTVGTYQFRTVAKYAEGAIMQTSKGATPEEMRYNTLNGTENTTNATVTNPHPTGTTNTTFGLTVYVTLPVFATTANVTTFNELTLQPWGPVQSSNQTQVEQNSGNWIVTFPDTDADNPIKIKTPRKLKSVNAFNTLTSKFDIYHLTNNYSSTALYHFKVEETTETVNGTSYKYYLYTWTGGALSSSKFKITCN